jgi:hypothetical protein
MENQSTKKASALLFIGLASLILAMTVFKESNTPKMIILGVSIASFLASIYSNVKAAKENTAKSKEKE